MDYEKSLELKKHVGAIHSSNRLTLVQRKIANALLYNAYDELLTKDEHQIHIKTLCDLIGYDSKDYKAIKNALITLISTVIEWNLVDKDKVNKEEIWNASAIISEASIEGPLCTYSYSNKMRQLLYRPELYGRLNMAIQAKFKSTYGLALYENCVRYQNINHTPWFSIATFRKLMGVEEGKYLIFRDFKRRVLDKAIKEVNGHAPIMVAVRYKKEQRQVVALKFLIQRAEKEILACGSSSLGSLNPLIEKLQADFALSKNQITKVLAAYDEAYIFQKIAIIESSSTFKAGKIGNLAKYLENALEQDYQPHKSSLERIAVMRKEKKENDELKELKKEQMKRYQVYQSNELLKIYHQLPDQQQNHITKDFQKYIENSLYANLFLHSGLSNVLVADKFSEFIKMHKKELLQMLLTFEEYIKSS